MQPNVKILMYYCKSIDFHTNTPYIDNEKIIIYIIPGLECLDLLLIFEHVRYFKKKNVIFLNYIYVELLCFLYNSYLINTKKRTVFTYIEIYQLACDDS